MRRNPHQPAGPAHVPLRRRRQHLRRDRALQGTGPETGDTLIEVLVTITVLGLAIVSGVEAFASVIESSARHREFATIDTVLKNFAESATYQIQMQSNPYFVPCATVSGIATESSKISYGVKPLDYQPPTGYTVQVSSPTQYLYNNSNFQASQCDSAQYWPQLITVTATGPKGSSASLSFVVADPAKLETYVQPTTTTSTTTSTTSTTTTVPKKIHVSDMVGGEEGPKQNWDALVTIYVQDANKSAVSGVTVTGSWSPNVSTADLFCTTDSVGKCQVKDGYFEMLDSSVKSATFTVSGLSMAGYTYDPGSNTTIPTLLIVNQP
jgi:type II secretory pathway pseudopilin PulG